MKPINLLESTSVLCSLEEKLNFETNSCFLKTWRWADEFDPKFGWWLIRDDLRGENVISFSQIPASVFVACIPEVYEPWNGAAVKRSGR